MTAYLRMLTLNRLAAFRPGSYAKEGKSKFVTVLKVIGFGLLMLLLYASVAFLEVMVFDLLHKAGQGQAVIGLGLLGCTLITLVYGFFNINGVLFFSRDTSFLASLPLSSRTIMTGKVLTTAAGEAGISLLFGLPLIVCCGVTSGAGVGFYLKALVAYALVPLVPLAVVTLLSFLLIRVSALWKRREGMTTIISFAFFLVIIIGEMSLQNMDEAEMTKWLLSLVLGQQSLSNMLLRRLPWLRWATNGVLENGALGQLLLYVLVSVAAIALVVLLLGGSYMKLALRQQEAIGRINSSRKRVRGKEDVRKPVIALMWQEIRDVLTVPVYATNCLIGLLMMPLMAGMILFTLNHEGVVGELLELVKLAPAGLVLAVLTAVFGLAGSMNEATSTAVSREGKRHELRKTYPLSGAEHLCAKTLMGLVFHGVVILAMAVVVLVLFPSFWKEVLLAVVCSLPLAYLLSTLGLVVDVVHPKLNWKTETEAIKQNFGAMIAMLINLVVMALLIGLYVLLVVKGMDLYWAFAIAMALALLMCAAVYLWLEKVGAKRYYRY